MPQQDNHLLHQQIDRLEQALVSTISLFTTALLALGLLLPLFKIVAEDDKSTTGRLWSLWVHTPGNESSPPRGMPDGPAANLLLLTLVALSLVALVITVRQHGRQIGRKGKVVAQLTAPLLLLGALVLVVRMQQLGWAEFSENADSSGFLVVGAACWWFLAGAISFAVSVWVPTLVTMWTRRLD